MNLHFECLMPPENGPLIIDYVRLGKRSETQAQPLISVSPSLLRGAQRGFSRHLQWYINSNLRVICLTFNVTREE